MCIRDSLQKVADEAVADRAKVHGAVDNRTKPLAARLEALEAENHKLRVQNLQMKKQQDSCSCVGSKLFKSGPSSFGFERRVEPRSSAPLARSDCTPASTASSSPVIQAEADQSDLALFNHPKPSSRAASPSPLRPSARNSEPAVSSRIPGLGNTLGVGRSAAWATRANRGYATANDHENNSVRSTDSYEKLADERARYQALENKVRVLREKTPPRERAKLDGLLGKLSTLHTGLGDLSSESGSTTGSPRDLSLEPRAATPNTLRRMKLTAADLADERRRKEVLAAKLRRIRDSSPEFSSESAAKLDSLAKKLDGVHQNLHSEVQSLRKNRGDLPSQEL
eukprot:TRINITY_DN33347_c0_g1_i4.p1 TRINITY_DN33347_c0_g1~~TRINITY_DN33347_c0_g1_i4.p1  ORF type:complete len:339 (-),score=73.23 TRINITY_DN33347_c0_g1_i4:142-1158(-)